MSTKKAPVRRPRVSSKRPPPAEVGPGFFAFYLPLIICLSAGFASVLLLRTGGLAGITRTDWIPLALAVGLPLAAVASLKLGRFKGDWSLLWLALLLSGLGVLFKFRTGAPDSALGLAQWQLPLLIGVAAMILCALAFGGVGRKLLVTLAPLAWIAAIAVLATILALGSRYRGMVYLAGNMNPSELCKPLLVLAVAGFLARRAARDGTTPLDLHTLATLGLLWCLPMGLLLIQRDLGMIIQLNATLLLMLYAANGRIAWLAGGLAALVAFGYALCHFNLHGAERIFTWLHPYRDPTGTGWQVLQSLSAQYTGGLFGTGIGTGSPHSVPIVASDFIYAAIAEEAGYLGSLLIILAYATLFIRSGRAALVQKDPFARLLVGGLVFSLALQTALNIAGATKTLPMTGITLPLISHGGSSLVTSLAMIGIILAHTTTPAKPK